MNKAHVPGFVPLHVKSDYSLGYGTASVEALVDRAVLLGYSAIALTDLENLYAQVRLQSYCCARGVRPLTGIELRPGYDGLREFGTLRGRLVLLALDGTGYRNLCRIVSRRRGAGRPEIEKNLLRGDLAPLLAGCSDGLFVLSDDSDAVAYLLSAGVLRARQSGLLLIRPGAANDLRLVEASRTLGVKLVADLDVFLLRPEDYELHLLQRAIREGRRLPELGLPDSDRGRWLHSPEEAARLFADLPQTLRAAGEIADMCRLEWKDLQPPHAGLQLVSGEEAQKRLRRTCEEAAARLKGTTEWSSEHAARLEQELGVFDRLGLSALFWVVAEILSHCRTKRIPVLARGSAVSSLTLYLLGASPVDPIAHGLIFERFVHARKSEWPDVDLDLPWDRRDEVIDWVYRRFGRDRVATVAAHHTFQRRSALREGLKAWGARPALIEAMSRALPPGDLEIEKFDFLDLATAAERDRVVVDETMPRSIEQVLPLVQRLIGHPHHIAAHPGGIVIGEGPLEDLLPLDRAPKGVVITEFDMTALARLGFVKIDLLGNRCLSEIEESLTLAGRGRGTGQDIPSEDAETLDLIDRAKTVGCFQLESPAIRSLLARVPIRRQKDITTALALIRPGAAAGEAKAAFIRRARGEATDQLSDPALTDRLAETHGLLLYEEDVMALLSRVGGIDLSEADELRSAIVQSGGDPGRLGELEQLFLERAAASAGTGESDILRAKRAWKAAARFAAYSFNKAHASSYAHLAYLSAYLKVHHPLEFSCALLNHHQGFYPLRTMAGEIARLGVILRTPHVNRSAHNSQIEERSDGERVGAIRMGLDKVKTLSRRVAREILEEREAHGPFSTLRDLLDRVRISHRELPALVLAGVCDGLTPLMPDLYPFVHQWLLDRIREGTPVDYPEGFTLPRDSDSARVKLYQALVRVRNELRYLEMHVSAHPLALLRSEANRYGCITVSQAALAPGGHPVRLAVTIAALRRVPTRSGPMQFLTMEDETGLIEGSLLPPAYRRIGEQVATPGPFMIAGRMQHRPDAVYVDISELTPFHKRPEPFGRLCVA